jgi:hypothetical protein
MSIDTEAPTATPAAARPRPRRGRWIAFGLVAALVLGLLVSAFTYRRTVVSERTTVFDSAMQAQAMATYDEMQRMGFGEDPRDAAAMQRVVALELNDYYPSRYVRISAGNIRVEGDTLYVVFNAEAGNGDLPWWVGDVYRYESLLLYGTYLSANGEVSSDQGSCMIRSGSADAPLAEGTVNLSDRMFAEACTQEQLVAAGIA